MTACAIEGCSDPARARGWCHKHYKRWQLNGDPLTVKRISGPMPLRERFYLQFRRDASGCWIWTGTISVAGYGQIKVHRRTTAAHRVSYELHRAPIPRGMFVCHRCDVRACVNPCHFFIGTARDNAKDRDQKGRGADRKGEKHPLCKLTDGDVREIRQSGERGCDLADKFGVARSTITQIRKGQRRTGNIT